MEVQIARSSDRAGRNPESNAQAYPAFAALESGLRLSPKPQRAVVEAFAAGGELVFEAAPHRGDGLGFDPVGGGPVVLFGEERDRLFQVAVQPDRHSCGAPPRLQGPLPLGLPFALPFPSHLPRSVVVV